MVTYAAQLITKVGTEGVEESKRQLSEMGKKVDESKSHFEGLKNALSTAGGFALFAGVGAGIGFAKDQISSILDLTKEYQLTQAQTNQVLKSTHDVSGMTAESLDKLAQAYGRTTQFSADTVQGGENLLLTFTNIGKKVFPQATQAILDVSQAMGQDLKSSAIQVGKALGDPLTGMTALQRIGVTFSAQEKEQIKTMMAHNDIIGAQKVILHELSTEFGGSATAAGKTFSGQMAILKNQFDDIKIKIGSALLPVLSDLMNKYVVPLAKQFQDWMFKEGGLQDFQQWMKNAVNFLESQLIPDFQLLLNQALLPLAQATYDLFVKSGFLSNAFKTLQGIFQTIVPWIGDFVRWMQQGSPGANLLKDAMIVLGLAVATVKIGNIVSDMASFIGSVPQMLSQMLLVQGGAKAIAGTEGLEAIGPAARDAEAAIATASAGMELSLAGVLTSIGLVAGGEIAIAMWLRQNNIVPAAPINGNSPSWVTHNWRNANPNDNPYLKNKNSDVLPPSMTGANRQIQTGQAINQVILQVDGAHLAQVILPHVVDQVRYQTGVRGI